MDIGVQRVLVEGLCSIVFHQEAEIKGWMRAEPVENEGGREEHEEREFIALASES